VVTAAVLSALAGCALAAAQPPAGGGDVVQTLGRIGSRVEDYYSHAQSILARETVRIERQQRDMSTVGRVRRLVYELNIEWIPPSDDTQAGEANVVRQLISVDGRPPEKGDDDGCMDPEPVTPEPMMMLLPAKQADYAFSIRGPGRTDGRRALMVDYKARAKGKAEIKWKDTCVSVSLPGWSRGRVWVDPSTHDVLRLDEELVGMFEFPVPREKTYAGGPIRLTVERSDSSIRYQTVKFREPNETVMLPRSIETTSVWRNAPVPRVRVTQTFTDYRRFLSDSRILPASPP